jgi:hypothetical protein
VLYEALNSDTQIVPLWLSGAGCLPTPDGDGAAAYAAEDVVVVIQALATLYPQWSRRL